MIKRLEMIQATRHNHECSAPGCGKQIRKGEAAIALVHEEGYDGKKDKYIAYFCSIDCYNEYESRVIYAAGSACEEGNGQLVFG
jgi:hypothetical protein